MKRPDKKPRYRTETELAHYVLSEFIDPLAGASKYKGSPKPYNFNEVLNHIYSKTGVFKHAFSFSKAKLQKHLFQEETHYYRSKRKGIHREGYGGSDEHVLSILNKYLGITKEAYDKYYDSNLRILLLKFDHDAHNGEADSARVQEWIVSEYFSDTHKEPSTSLTGDHGYIKVAYPSNVSIAYVCDVIEKVFALLDKKRELLGYSSPLDPPCGLPNLTTWNSSISIGTLMPRISYTDYRIYCNVRTKVMSGEIPEPDASSINISSSVTYSCIEKILSIPVACSVKQSQCGKVPRFITRDNPYSPSIDSIISFYNLRYYPFSHFTSLLTSLTTELGTTSSAQGDLARCHSPNAPWLEIQTNFALSNEEEEGEEGRAIIVSSPEGEQRGSIGHVEKSNKDRTQESQQDDHNSTDEILRERYLERIEQIRQWGNKAAITNSFYWHYSNYVGYVPEVEEAEEEYLRLGLNQTLGKGIKNRMRRLEAGKRYVLTIWDDSKRGFNLDEWEDIKEKMIERICDAVESSDKSWVKDRTRNQIYDITVEELALVYYAIHKSNTMDKHRKSEKKGSFSYLQVQNCFKLAYGKKCHRAKGGRILAILREAGLIKLVGTYEIGKYGNKYAAVA